MSCKLADFTAHLKGKHTQGTVKRYTTEIDRFFTSLAKKKLNPKKATYQQIIDYLGEVRTHQKNPSCTLSALKKYYDFLLVKKVRKDHPCKSIKLRDKPTKNIQLQDLFTREELEMLLKRKERYVQLKNRNRIILSLLIYQGLTNGEICRIELGDIDLEKGEIYIKSTKTTNSRTLKLQSKQVFWLINYIEKDRNVLLKSPSDRLVIGKLGTPEKGEGISYLVETQKHLFPMRNLSPITIRQSVITNLLKEGKDLRLVQVFAGHKRPSSTERYKQSDDEKLKNKILLHHPLR